MFTYESYKSMLNEFELIHAPKQLFFDGNISLLTEGIRVCVVGSRDVSSDGIRRALFITKYLVECGITVVSGLALGTDSIAHKTTIANNGKTIAVLGTPLDISSPKSNLDLLNEIKKNHLAISQFEYGSTVYQGNFPIRNKTMALISDATIIVEAGEKSGTKHQGWEALRIGRRLFLMENVLQNSWAKEMVNYGAQVLTRQNYEELINEIPIRDFSETLLECLS